MKRTKEQQRLYYQNHRAQILASQRKYFLAHREQILAKGRARARVYHQNHRWDRRSFDRGRYEIVVAEAFRVLGDKCACPGCGVSEPRFLFIDHIRGRAKHGPTGTVWEAQKSGWDKTKFQILCGNCNLAKRNRGFCPVHQKASDIKNAYTPGLETGQISLWPLGEEENAKTHRPGRNRKPHTDAKARS